MVMVLGQNTGLLTATVPMMMTDTTPLENAIARLQHVYRQTDSLRHQIQEQTPLLERIAYDEFAVYRHNFNNTLTPFHNDIGALSVKQLHEDPELYRDILADAVGEIISRTIEDGHWNKTDLRGYSETIPPLIDEIKSKMDRGYLKGENLADARTVIGDLEGVMANTTDLLVALNDVIALLPPTKTIDAAQSELHTARKGAAIT